MILGEFGPIFFDKLFTQTARNGTVDIHLSDFTHVRLRNFFKKFERVLLCRKEGLSSLVRDHSASATSTKVVGRIKK